MPTLTFLPAHTRVPCTPGESVFAVARRHHIAVATSCGGQGTCGRCRIRIVSGGAAIAAPREVDSRHLGNVYFITHIRLACQCFVGEEDLVVEIM